MQRLAAGRRTGIQDTHTGLGGEQHRGQLRACVLNRHPARGKIRQRGDRYRRHELHGRRRPAAGARLDAGLMQQRQIGRNPGARQVHAQGHRRVHIVGQHHGGRLLRPGAAQGRGEPGRMGRGGHRVNIHPSE